MLGNARQQLAEEAQSFLERSRAQGGGAAKTLLHEQVSMGAASMSP